MNGLSKFSGQEPKAAREGATGTALGFGVKHVRERADDSLQYEIVGGRRMVGVYVCVWARAALKPHISSWQA
jgi:hypothetical protein